MNPNNAALFDDLYRRRAWDENGTAPLSGKGSTVQNSYPVLEWIRRLQPQSVVDVGCGDLTWMKTALQEHHFNYVGIDVSEEALTCARANMANESGSPVFIHGDITAPFFRVDADLVIVKDVLMHLTTDQVLAALFNLSDSTWRHLVLNTDPGSNDRRREDMNSAHWSMVDLESPMFVGLLRRLGTIADRKPRPEHGEYLLISK